MANAFGVTPRSIREWRRRNDKRCVEWSRKWAQRHGDPDPLSSEDQVAGAADDDMWGIGITAEIQRAQAECKRLAQRAAILERQNNFDDSALIHRILDAKRDALRKLSQDNPDILAKLGDLMPRTVIFAYVAKVKMMLEAVPRRLMAIVPDDLRDTLRPAIEAEIAAVLNAAKDIDIAA